MATDMQRLIVSLEARTKAFENALNKANGVANARAKAIESRFARMNKNLTSGFTAVGGKLAAAFAVAGGAQAAKGLIDSAIRIDNALKTTGLSGEALTKVYDALYLSAQRNAAPLETLVTLYGRASLVQKELGVSTAELLSFTDRVALALRVSGQSAEAAQGALLQLGQALSTGVVRAEEYNSLQEGATPILRAVAAGLKEAGGSVGALTNLVKSGKVSSEAFFRAFEAGAPVLEGMVANSVLTIDQRLTNLRTALVDAARRFNESSEAANTFGEAIDNVADFVNSIDMDALIQEITTVITAFQQGIQWANNFGRSISEALGAASGLDNVGKMLTGGAAQRSFLGGALTVTSSKALQERIDAAFENQIQQAGALTEEAIKASVLGQGQGTTPKTGRLTGFKPVVPVSLNDFAPPPGSKSGGGGKKSKENEYQREIEQIRERTAALQAETAAMADINPLVNDYGFAIEKARVAQELLAAAQAAGLAITPELKANIETLATAYATASAESEKLAEKQDKLRDMAEEFNGLAKDVLSGFIQDLKDGKSATEALEGALSKVADKLLDMALSSIFGGTGGIGGLLAGLFGYAEGGYTGSGGKNQAAGVVHKGEYVFSKKATQRLGVGNLEAMHRSAKGYASGGFVGPAAPRIAGPATTQAATSITVAISAPINAPGADPAQLARVERSVQELGRNVPKIVESTIHQKQTRKGRP